MVIGSKKFSSDPIRVARIDNGHGKAVRVSYRLFPSVTELLAFYAQPRSGSSQDRQWSPKKYIRFRMQMYTEVNWIHWYM